MLQKKNPAFVVFPVFFFHSPFFTLLLGFSPPSFYQIKNPSSSGTAGPEQRDDPFRSVFRFLFHALSDKWYVIVTFLMNRGITVMKPSAVHKDGVTLLQIHMQPITGICRLMINATGIRTRNAPMIPWITTRLHRLTKVVILDYNLTTKKEGG